MGTTRWKWLAAIALAVCGLTGGNPKAIAAERPAVVHVLQVDGIISPATSDFITRGLKNAADAEAALVVIELDTPGGLDTSMRSIIRHILASPVPVATFVGPSGARAASAGTFILYASHIAAMAPASNLGAATPVSIGREPAAEEDQHEKANDAANTDTHARKATNDAAAYIRSLAQLRGRNAEFAEQAVHEARSLSAPEALQAGVIDLLAGTVEELVHKVDGREVALDGGQTVQLSTSQAAIERIEPDWRTRLLGLIANPQVALILMMIGIYGLFFELTSPGIALPGVAGLICLVLGLYAFHMLPVNWAGVALAGAGAAMMIAEAFLPSFGVLGIGGVVAFVLGGLFLSDTGIPGYDLSVPFLIGFGIVSALLIALTAMLAARAYKRAVVSGREEMLGLPGIVTSVSGGTVYAEVRGESWKVRSGQVLAAGDAIRVVAMDGLTLDVIRNEPGDPESGLIKGEGHV